MKLGLKEGISIDADFGSLEYVLSYWVSICHQVFTFIQIGYAILWKDKMPYMVQNFLMNIPLGRHFAN